MTGREERYDGFEGEPRAVGGALGGSSTGHTGSHSTTSGYGSSGAGPHSSSLENKVDPRVDSDGSRGYGSGATGTGSGYGSSHTGTGTGYGSSNTGNGTGYGTPNTTATGKKPGLMDKLNPMKDTDGDGKKGFME